ncbi:MAG TPA: hypothetical protein VLG92_03555 [Candidatus Saccharimonadia bacterium]|nr:hypothetical protein [Candidatus Saccharimonadia bacterium]
MQRVDPFIPVSLRPTRPIKPVDSASQLVKYATSPPRMIEDFVQPKKSEPASLDRVAVPAARALQQPSPPKLRKAKATRSRLSGKLRTSLLVVVVLVAGTMTQVESMGEMLIIAYAIYVFVRRVASRTTFMLVLVSLATIVLLRLVGKDPQLAANFAVYSFLLVLVGVISLAYEVRRS